jgi:ADP-ribose pyrophosphatase
VAAGEFQFAIFSYFADKITKFYPHIFVTHMNKDLTWKTLSSSYIHKGPWATLRTDRCEMPGGHIVEDYYVLEYNNWVNAVAITEDNKILMVHQYRHAAGIVSLEIPGGVIDDGELPEQAIRRELLEETGYQFDDFELLCTIYANPSTANNHTYCYLAKGGKKVQSQHLDEQEEIIVETFTISEIKQLLAENKIAQALHCTGLFYALQKLNK